ncbi:MAG: NADH:flavin oxidoreductase [Deltaproteobacteria bacterium]|nr:MAG: NADH:flavin oxidoreductase [Deltaproteobacteria bacterium]
MIDMFTPGKLGSLELKNRLVRSAVWEGMADDQGFVTDKLVTCIRRLAEGGMGLIILGYTYIQPNGRQSPGQTAIYNDDYLPGLRKLTDTVHKAGGRISIQLVHVGPQTTPDMIHGKTPVGPSAIKHPLFGTPRELTTAEVKRIIEDFGHSAKRAKTVGFDAIQIHGAHGYLVNQFISPRWNQRSDAYGGSPENRMRFATEVYREVRANANNLPVFIKLNLDDFIKGSTTPADALPLAEKLSEMGIDAIEVSGGGPASRKGPARIKIRTEADEAYFIDLARQTRKVTTCPIILVGGFRSPRVIDQVLASGDVDFVSMARPLIREPGLVNRWRSGDLTKAKCISCNGCFKTLAYGEGIQCLVEYKDKERYEKKYT